MPTRSHEAKINSTDALRNGEYVKKLESVPKELAGANVPCYSKLAAGVLSKKVSK